MSKGVGVEEGFRCRSRFCLFVCLADPRRAFNVGSESSGVQRGGEGGGGGRGEERLVMCITEGRKDKKGILIGNQYCVYDNNQEINQIG